MLLLSGRNVFPEKCGENLYAKYRVAPQRTGRTDKQRGDAGPLQFRRPGEGSVATNKELLHVRYERIPR